MAKTIVNMELSDANLSLLGEEGVIPPLLEMLSGNIELKEVSLSALVKLLDSHANKRTIAACGGVPIILEQMFSPSMRTIITIKCSEILEKLSADVDGINFFVDREGKQLELDSIITKLLALQQSPTLAYNIRKPSLRALLGICKFETGLVKKAVLAASGVSLILPLLDDSDLEIRQTAINLLFLFSQHEPEGVVEYLFKPRRLEALVGFLETNDNDVQMAAAGLLANLPKSEKELTMKLIELGGLDAIICILKTGTMEAKENALSALFRFTDPTNIESQRDLVKRGIYPLLVNFLNTGSITAKARAAAFIGDLSTTTPMLTLAAKSPGCWCIRPSRVHFCPAHGCVCSVSNTFCLLEAQALPGLVNLLREEVDVTAYEAIQTLSTLVLEDYPQKGAHVLHEANAIKPLMDILTWGSDSLKAEALGLMEKVFLSKEMVELHGATARSRLVGLTGMNIHGEGHLRRKAAKVLSLIERYSRSSSAAVSGVLE